MASSLSRSPSISFYSVVKTTATSPHLPLSKLSFRFSSRPIFRFFSKSLQTGQNCSALVKAQLNEVGVDGSSNAKSSSNLKQLDRELITRKNVALPQPPSAAPDSMIQASSLPPVGPPVQTAPAPSGNAPPAAATPAPSTAPPKSAKSSLPPLKCPMTGTFYRSPGPGEPPFVKVGDKVQKGQVVCIIEAMKLMNEIEADQSGTIVEILVEEGKAVSVDTPLFVIEP
ncbi:Biotin carboxyl carrier protein of acetyl-CoA carboxylase 2 [Hibiscus syriacus]|uniref:Biotin carboxyl carrier protein of acetyl-CoA carboxylase n=1 Tax=Hibiscus syriacus TaxID=106335 RepID=A0A6A3D1I2_HIBSY|nr:Biotin carboxyl carrier protein of acetyl-CoA carboxylase 2 [Hibiscus syriacus]